MFNSIAQKMNPVTFPEYRGERVYMEPFFQKYGLPTHLARWQTTVDQMLAGVLTDEPIYLMIDQAPVSQGVSHRRPGVHVDGYWDPGLSCHGTPGHRFPSGPSHHIPKPTHRRPGGHILAKTAAKEAIILASNIAACRGFMGNFNGPIGEGGDCSHLNLNDLLTFEMEPNTAYAGNVTFLHESLPVMEDCNRTLVRLNVPGWEPKS